MSDPHGQSTSDRNTPGQETPGPSEAAPLNPTADPVATGSADTDPVAPAGSADTAGPVVPAGSVAPAGLVDADADPADPGYAERRYRSVPSMVAGGLLTALALWLCIDAMVEGHGRTPWFGLATLALVLPLFTAFTFWPVVRADRDRLLVRNPFRTITAPWGEVETVQAALSVELRAGGKKYQVWAVPVSLRQRKRVGRRAMMAKGDAAMMDSRRTRTGFGGAGGAGSYPVGGPGLLRGRARGGAGSGDDGAAPAGLAWADRVVAELNTLSDEAEARPAAVGSVSVVWTWWIIAPAVAGAVALVVLGLLG
ncbi:PH domain-containing protein [Streptacidiphilus sp. PAMC 29251]